MNRRLWRLLALGLLIVGGSVSPVACAQARWPIFSTTTPGTAQDSPSGVMPAPTGTPSAESVSQEEALAADIAVLLEQASLEVREVVVAGDEVIVCLDVSSAELAAGGWLGIEALNEAVRRALVDVTWTTLFVHAWDDTEGRCVALSDFAPATAAIVQPLEEMPDPGLLEATALAAGEFPQSLQGKTVYVSAGHGWFFNGTTWRTQRPVYQGFIEDHNNAEVVTQYLIPYLENAGATVIPVRERDWNPASVIADNDAGPATYAEVGVWTTGSHTAGGYNGGTYRFADADANAVTATATWTLSVPEDGTYALYAWIYPGSNRIHDARYTIAHAGGATEVRLDQRVMPRTWRYLGTFPFKAGVATVTLDNRTSGAGGVVVADALRLGGGTFDTLAGLPLLAPATSYAPSTPPGSPPWKLWWESATFYWAQRGGLDPDEWPYFNDVVARPMFARWHQRVAGTNAIDNAVYISWHTNGSSGTARGTVSYIHNGDTYPVTPGSTALQAAVHDELIHDIRAGWNAAWIDRGKGRLDLGEIRMLWDPTYEHARIPGVLLEIAFHDNPDDAEALKEPLFNQLAARAVYQGIVAYFDARDGHPGDLVLAPDPPVAVSARNVGDGTLRISWAPSPVDGIGLGGAAATGYRVYTSPDGFAWGAPTAVVGTSLTLSGLMQGQTLYMKVTATNAGGESFPTEVVGARVGVARLLLINGFDKLNRSGLVVESDPVENVNLRMWLDQINSQLYVVHHGQAVPEFYAWDSASNEAVARGDVILTAYSIVDWILGEEGGGANESLSATERDLLRAYLSAGRALFISGSEYAWDLEALGRDPDFLHNTLATDYVADDAATYQVRPAGAGIFAGLGDLSFDAPEEYDVDYPDVLAPYTASGAQVALTYVGGSAAGQAAAIQSALATPSGPGCYRVLALGFPFETIRPAQRAQVMERALDFLDCAVDTTITWPEDGGYYRTSPQLRGLVMGADTTGAEVQLQRSDGLYWTSAGWSPTAAWLVAQMAALPEWTYWVPLGEGAYTLRARATGPTSVDDTPAQVVFGVDITAPFMPTVVTPTGAITITAPLFDLVWIAPDDAGSPLHYEVQIDGRLYGTATVGPYAVTVGSGMHVWRVRAVDAAGNASAWSEEGWFVVDVEQLFLPLTLRQ